MEARRGHWNSWNWRYKQSWGTQRDCWEPNMDAQEGQQVLLTSEPSLQLPLPSPRTIFTKIGKPGTGTQILIGKNEAAVAFEFAGSLRNSWRPYIKKEERSRHRKWFNPSTYTARSRPARVTDRDLVSKVRRGEKEKIHMKFQETTKKWSWTGPVEAVKWWIQGQCGLHSKIPIRKKGQLLGDPTDMCLASKVFGWDSLFVSFQPPSSLSSCRQSQRSSPNLLQLLGQVSTISSWLTPYSKSAMTSQTPQN